MCYQLPALITKDGRPIIGGTDINVTDRAFGRRIYPPAPGASVEGAQEGASYDRASQDDSEFVREPVLVD